MSHVRGTLRGVAPVHPSAPAQQRHCFPVDIPPARVKRSPTVKPPAPAPAPVQEDTWPELLASALVVFVAVASFLWMVLP